MSDEIDYRVVVSFRCKPYIAKMLTTFYQIVIGSQETDLIKLDPAWGDLPSAIDLLQLCVSEACDGRMGEIGDEDTHTGRVERRIVEWFVKGADVG